MALGIVYRSGHGNRWIVAYYRREGGSLRLLARLHSDLKNIVIAVEDSSWRVWERRFGPTSSARP